MTRKPVHGIGPGPFGLVAHRGSAVLLVCCAVAAQSRRSAALPVCRAVATPSRRSAALPVCRAVATPSSRSAALSGCRSDQLVAEFSALSRPWHVLAIVLPVGGDPASLPLFEPRYLAPPSTLQLGYLVRTLPELTCSVAAAPVPPEGTRLTWLSPPRPRPCRGAARIPTDGGRQTVGAPCLALTPPFKTGASPSARKALSVVPARRRPRVVLGTQSRCLQSLILRPGRAAGTSAAHRVLRAPPTLAEASLIEEGRMAVWSALCECGVRSCS